MRKTIFVTIIMFFPIIFFGQNLASSGHINHFPPTDLPGEKWHMCDHIRLSFIFGPNKYKETITGIEFKWTMQDAFGDYLHSGKQKWGITINSNEKSLHEKYLYWERCDILSGGQKIYNKINPLVSNIKVVVVITRIAFKDGTVIRF